MPIEQPGSVEPDTQVFAKIPYEEPGTVTVPATTPAPPPPAPATAPAAPAPAAQAPATARKPKSLPRRLARRILGPTLMTKR